jgi:hypothetical protein
MELKSSLDWSDLKQELIKEASLVFSYQQIHHMTKNIEVMIRDLGNLEIQAKRMGHRKAVTKKVAEINSVLETFENIILLERLSK